MNVPIHQETPEEREKREDREWQEIANTLTTYFGICACQRKIKTIIDNLYSIYEKGVGAYEGTHKRDFTGAEWLIIAILDDRSTGITHGINCEYPIIMQDDEFWQFVLKARLHPALKDG